MKEINSIPGFEDCSGYLMDEHGYVYSKKTGRFLSQQEHKGYCCVLLNVNRKRKHVYVHRLVWAYFHGEVNEKLQINHIDGNKKNNNISNLELISCKENIAHSYRIGLRTKTTSKIAGRGSGHICPVNMFSISGDRLATFEKIIDASRLTGVDASLITKACKGTAKTAGGFLWTYALDGATK